MTHPPLVKVHHALVINHLLGESAGWSSQPSLTAIVVVPIIAIICLIVGVVVSASESRSDYSESI